MSGWNLGEKLRTDALRLSVTLGAAAAICGIFAVFVPVLRVPATIFLLLTAHTVTACLLLSRVQRLQMQVDMLRMHKGLAAAPGVLNVAAGDTIEFRERAVVHVLSSCSLEII